MALSLYRRGGVWHMRGTAGGQSIRRSTGTRDRKAAEAIKAEAEARAHRAALLGPEHVVLFEEAALSYMDQGGEARFMAPLLHHFRGTPIGHIRPGHLADAANALYPGAAPATKNRQAITPAAAVINHAHQRGWCGPIRPRRMREPKPVRRAVDRAWLDAVLAEANPWLAATLLFLHQTGARIGDAIGVRPGDVDLDARTIRLATTKTGDPAVLALTGELTARLAALEARGGRVFGYASRSAVRKALISACARAGVPYASTHEAGRHSFATILSEEHGFSVAALMDAGRWSSPTMPMRYAHPRDAGRRAAAAFDEERRGDGGADPGADPAAKSTKSAQKAEAVTRKRMTKKRKLR